MPNLRQRIGRLFVGRELDGYAEGVRTLEKAYLAGKYAITPERLATQLREGASEQMFDLITRLTRDYVGSIGFQGDAEAMRKYYVNECRFLWQTDAVSQWAVWLWTNYGFGENIEILPEDKAAQEVWQAFWDYDKNAPVLGADGLHRLSENVLVDGEFLIIYYIDETGTKPPVVRTVPTNEIVEIITDPEDDATPLYYKREWTDKSGDTNTMYYADWLAVREEGALERAELPIGAELAQNAKENTTVVAQHVAHNRKEFDGPGRLRGWPMYSVGAAWARQHTEFREDRATVAAAVAMMVNKIKTRSGSRAIDNIADNLKSSLTAGTLERNPASAPGSTWVENEALELSRLSQRTWAGDAKIDGEALMQMAALGAGAYSHYFGSGDAYRLATATAMEGPTQRQWSRYQNFWGAQWRKMARIVLWAAEEYGFNGESVSFETHNAQVSTDRLVELGLTDIAAAMSSLLRDGLMPYLTMGVISSEVAAQIVTAVWQSALQALGITDVMDVVPPVDNQPTRDPEDEPDEKPKGEEPEENPEPASEEEIRIASALVAIMKGWDARMEMVEGALRESHEAQEVRIICPLEGCEGQTAYRYAHHPSSLLVCATCGRTFDTQVESDVGDTSNQEG